MNRRRDCDMPFLHAGGHVAVTCVSEFTVTLVAATPLVPMPTLLRDVLLATSITTLE
jgi:hypothetical protein